MRATLYQQLWAAEEKIHCIVHIPCECGEDLDIDSDELLELRPDGVVTCECGVTHTVVRGGDYD